MKNTTVVCAALAVALSSISPASALAADGVVTFESGADYSSGKYGGTQSTDIFYVPFTGKYETGPWTLKLVASYLRITGPGNVVGAGDNVIVLPPGANAPRTTESGWGDVVASAAYNVVNANSAPVGVDLVAKVKFGTADSAKGLGTGENDYAAQVDLYKQIGAFTPFGTIGYRWYGSPPGTPLQDVVYGSIGTSYRVSQPTTLGVAYDFRGRIFEGGGRVSEVTAYISQRLSGGWKLQVYGVAGFATASPDFGAGFTLAYSY